MWSTWEKQNKTKQPEMKQREPYFISDSLFDTGKSI